MKHRSIPWATLTNGLWRAPVAVRPRFPDAPRLCDRVSGALGRDHIAWAA